MTKISKILVGTHNRGKYKEICTLLPKKLLKISPIKLRIKSPKETGKTFFQNSRLKANYFFKKSSISSISDDSGLEISCLGKKPGIYSARWAKKYGSFFKAMKVILKLVEDKNKNKKRKNFKARFVCSLFLKISKKKSIHSIGILNGKLNNKIIGKNGFGYDPIFIPLGHKITLAQMSYNKKIKMDHRYIAFKKIKKNFTF